MEGLAGPLPGFLRQLISWVFSLPRAWSPFSLCSQHLPANQCRPGSPLLKSQLSPLIAILASVPSVCVLHTSFHFAPGRVPYHHSGTSLGQSNLGHCGDIINDIINWRQEGHFYAVIRATSPESKGSLTTVALLLTILKRPPPPYPKQSICFLEGNVQGNAPCYLGLVELSSSSPPQHLGEGVGWSEHKGITVLGWPKVCKTEPEAV